MNTPQPYSPPRSPPRAALLLLVSQLAACGDQVLGWPRADGTPPTVTSTRPETGELDVSPGAPITARFSEVMDRFTITPSSFFVSAGSTPVLAQVVYLEDAAVLLPTLDLQPDSSYVATITAAAKDLAGNPLAEDYVWSFRTSSAPDITAPLVITTTPTEGELGVHADIVLDAVFSEPMDPSTLTLATFTLAGPGQVNVQGEVIYTAPGAVAAFVPASDLLPDVTYTATIRDDATDLAGNPLAQDYVWSFKVLVPADDTPPIVILTSPSDDAVDVASSVDLLAAFSEPMDPATITAAHLQVKGPGQVPVPGAVSYEAWGPVGLFTPDSPLLPATLYTATVTTGVTDLAGNAMVQDYVWTFTVAGPADGTPPLVLLTSPDDGGADVPLDATLLALFSEAMDPATLTPSTIQLRDPDDNLVPGGLSYEGWVPISLLTPTSALEADTTYTATISTGVADLAGNHLAQDYVWSFTTAAPADLTPPLVLLTNPDDGDAGVPTDVLVLAAFSEGLDPASFNDATFDLRGPAGGEVPGVVLYDSWLPLGTFTPDAPLRVDTTYTATITTGITDLAGNHLAQDYVWSFTTAPAADDLAPYVLFTTPTDGATEVLPGAEVVVAFSEPMDPATLSSATFGLTGPGGVGVAGALLHLGTWATFTPSSPLDLGATYTAIVTTGAADLAGNHLAQDYVWTFTIVSAPDSAAPYVLFTSPDGGATDVLDDSHIFVAFSEPMDRSTFTSNTFGVTGPGGVGVAGALFIADNSSFSTFIPNDPLSPDTTYTGVVTAAVTDLAGNHLAQDYVWSFTVAAAPDTTAPLVILTSPDDASTDVVVGSDLRAAFSEDMDPASLNEGSFLVTGPGGAVVPGSVQYEGWRPVAIFRPDADLLPETLYSATITTGAADLAGNTLARDYVWTFTTAAPPDAVRPFVLFTSPEDSVTDVPLDATVNAQFSEAMAPASISGATFDLVGPDNTPIAGTVLYVGWSPTAIFTPAQALLPNSTYVATISAAAEDMAGNTLEEDYIWSFSTVAAPTGLLPIELASLQSFVAVAGAGLTNSNATGITTLNGDVGLSPVGTCLGDGAPCSLTNPVINGILYANDGAGMAAQAQTDLAAAYADGMGRPSGTVVNDLSGLTLSPGVYTSAAMMRIELGGTLVLDGQGDANAVWIFQVGASLTVNNDARVLLVNGARAKNVFWVVTDSTLLGTNVSFQGNVLAGASTTIGSESVVVGRLLSVTGQLSLLSNNVTLPPL